MSAQLQDKKILLCLTGSIAAYKAAFLTRLLVKSGAEVQVLMTPAATAFISPLTLSTLSRNPVHSEIISEESWNNHVELGLWADAMLVAPCTATTLAKMAQGLSDNIVVATYLSARCPVFFAPAMDLDMWQHPATRHNLERLQSYGNHLIPVGNGELASGLVGEGRMGEPEDIVQLLSDFFQQQQDLAGQRVLITAGPTYEPIDPVRFIGNHSSGKMGLALAEEAARRGAQVDLVLGPSALQAKHPSISTHRVQTAQQMYEKARDCFKSAKITILAAAVADYRPQTVADQKIKKKTTQMELVLEKTVDIAATLGQEKGKDQIMIGFALETTNEVENARGKLRRKNFDFIVLNSLQDAGAGFRHDTNKVSLIFADNNSLDFELKTKTAVAVDIIDQAVRFL